MGIREEGRGVFRTNIFETTNFSLGRVFLHNPSFFSKINSTMKKLLTAITGLSVWGLAAFAVPAAPADFAGLVWGSSMQVIKTNMEGKAGLDEKHSTVEKLVYSGGAFENFAVVSWDLFFQNGKFYQGRVKLAWNSAGGWDKSSGLQALAFERILTEKYGPPTQRQASANRRKKSKEKIDVFDVFWVLPSQLEHQVVIECFVEDGYCVLQYTSESIKPPAGH